MVVREVSEDQRVPDPNANDDVPETEPSPFANLSPEIIDLVFPDGPEATSVGDFAAPNHKVNKPKWWQRANSKNARKQSEPKPRKPMPQMAPSALRKGLVDFYNGIALMVMPFQPDLALKISQASEACADAWIEFSKTNPAVKRFLIGLVTASAGGALLMAHMPILIAAAIAFIPGIKEKQDEAMNAFVQQMSAGIPTTEGD